MRSTAVLTRIADGVGHVTLNRPEAMNAITIELATRLEAAFATLGGDRSVGAIVVRGAGGCFSVGGDFKELERLREQGRAAMAELFCAFRRACDAIARLPVPVVCAVEGYALAGGFELMQAADIAIVREDARIGDNHARFDQVPGGGGSQRLPRLVGRQRALGLILSGDHLSGAEAAAWGLAYRAVPADAFDAAVEELASRLAGRDRQALARIKALVRGGLDGTLAQGLDRERETVLDHLSGESGGRGVAAFNEGRERGWPRH